jgi:hypothetical protein
MYFTGFDEWRAAIVMQAKARRIACAPEVDRPESRVQREVPSAGVVQLQERVHSRFHGRIACKQARTKSTGWLESP